MGVDVDMCCVRNYRNFEMTIPKVLFTSLDREICRPDGTEVTWDQKSERSENSLCASCNIVI